MFTMSVMFFTLGFVLLSFSNVTSRANVNAGITAHQDLPPAISTTVSSASNEDRKPDVAFMFLVDESGSVIGSRDAAANMKCQYYEPVHKQNLITLFKILADIPKDQTQNVHIGISRFGEEYKSVIPLSPLSKINKKQLNQYLSDPNSNHDSETEYAEAIDKANSALENYLKNNNNMQRVLVILTDGFDINKEKVKIEEKFSGIPITTKIYVSLICPSELKNASVLDWNFWSIHRIPQANLPDDFFSMFFENSNLLYWKETHGITQQDEEVEVPVPGDAYRFQLYFYPFADSDEDNIYVTDENAYKYYSGLVNTIRPTGICAPRKYSLVADNASGFWWLKSSVLQLSPPEIAFAEKIVNFAPSLIKVRITPAKGQDLANNDFQIWAGCYQDVGFEYSYDQYGIDKPGLVRYPDLLAMPCENSSRSLCADKDNALSTTWNWNLVGDSTKDKFYVRPYIRNSVGEKIVGKEYTYDLYYKPVLLDTKLASNSTKVNEKDGSLLDVRTSYNLIAPTFSLARSLDFTKPVGITCPQPTSKDNERSFLKVEKQSVDALDYAIVSESPTSPRSNKYSLALVNYVYDACGYDTLIVSWVGTKNQLESVWECKYLTDKNTWLCNEVR